MSVSTIVEQLHANSRTTATDNVTAGKSTTMRMAGLCMTALGAAAKLTACSLFMMTKDESWLNAFMTRKALTARRRHSMS